MKKTYLLIAFITCLCFSLNAQLRLLQNGRVQVGTLKEGNEDVKNVTTMQVFGPYGDMRSGSKLTFGDFGQYDANGWNVFLGEYGTSDTDQLWLHGKKGIYMTSNGQASTVIASYDPSVNANFVFNTNLRVNGVNITSDARLKENVESLQNTLGIIDQLNGVSYNYKLSEINKYREPDGSKFSQDLSTQKNTNSDLSTNAALTEKEIQGKLYQSEIERKEAEEASRKRIGFLAQDVEKVLPELVRTDENGIKSIDYTGFIPLIVESLKEMQQTIQDQQNEIENLRSLLPEGTKSMLRSTSTNNINVVEGAKLYNRAGTSVSYILPSAFSNAYLQVFDIAGRILKKITLTTPNDIVEINPSEIGLGTFIYVLYVDGQKADTLKKIIN
ncbi:tail fiber domain-containing protein [Parabacteroides sp. W1-Q-101]|uniref:tail fiber domain-containing protein n=1 Tax=Parabacteroides TaxID=375288 RepID=UPI00202DC2B2|nr:MULTISPECIES: tail fiber domain-containing protein [unclassified Parabacteroides]MCM0720867.1 tail fiber domain-containing protein [Parabacteroides sp. W1-Q-101]